MRERCVQCLTPLPPGSAHTSPDGELNCRQCYLALWGPQGLRRRENGGPATTPEWLARTRSSASR